MICVFSLPLSALKKTTKAITQVKKLKRIANWLETGKTAHGKFYTRSNDIQNSHDIRDNILFPQEEPRLESDSL